MYGKYGELMIFLKHKVGNSFTCMTKVQPHLTAAIVILPYFIYFYFFVF